MSTGNTIFSGLATYGKLQSYMSGIIMTPICLCCMCLAVYLYFNKKSLVVGKVTKISPCETSYSYSGRYNSNRNTHTSCVLDVSAKVDGVDKTATIVTSKPYSVDSPIELQVNDSGILEPYTPSMIISAGLSFCACLILILVWVNILFVSKSKTYAAMSGFGSASRSIGYGFSDIGHGIGSGMRIF